MKTPSNTALQGDASGKGRRELRSDGEATRARILEAAGKLFAMNGLAEITNKAIAAKAEVDLASINYHFGNRDGLYRSVLAEAHHRLENVTELRQLADSQLPATSKLRMLMQQIVEISREEPRPWHLGVLAREVLVPSSYLEAILGDASSPKILLIRRLLSQITKIPEDDPALTRCMLSIGAPSLMLLVGGPAYPSSWQDVFQMPADVVVEHLYRFALGGLQAVGDAYRESADT